MTRASDIWPHLNKEASEPRGTPRPPSSLAASMYPSLAPPKPKPSNPLRDALLRNLREINGRHKRS
jgi:hypothetical protein